MDIQIEEGCAEDERPLARIVLSGDRSELIRSLGSASRSATKLASGGLVFTVRGRQAYLNEDNVLVLAGVSTEEEAAVIMRLLAT